jgi:hypothetical protein
MTKEEEALVCEWLGIPQKEPAQWTIVFPGDSVGLKWSPPFLEEAQADEYLAEPGIVGKGYRKQFTDAVYPDLLSWSGFGLMVEALERKGRHVDFALNRYCGKYEVEVNTNDRGEVSGCDSMPEALAQAVLALAKKERG